MSIKDDLKQINEELGNERILEGAFRLEAFFKKNKFWILAVLIGMLIWGLIYQIGNYLKERNALEITAIFNEIRENGSNQDLLDRLKDKSDELYEFVVFSEALKNKDKAKLQEMQTSKNSFIAQCAHYEYSSITENFNEKNYGDFRDLVLLEEGYLSIIKGDHKSALKKLNEIAPTSELRELALRIGHYGITN